MRLRVNLIANGRYYVAGEDIAQDELPAWAGKYSVDVDPPPAMATIAQRVQAPRAKLKPRPKPNVKASFVKRDGEFVTAANAELIPGEPLFWHRKKSFGVDERFIVYGRVPKASHEQKNDARKPFDAPGVS